MFRHAVRRYAAGAEFVPPARCSIEFRNSLLSPLERLRLVVVAFVAVVLAVAMVLGMEIVVFVVPVSLV
jgi:hypothetical protein